MAVKRSAMTSGVSSPIGIALALNPRLLAVTFTAAGSSALIVGMSSFRNARQSRITAAAGVSSDAAPRCAFLSAEMSG